MSGDSTGYLTALAAAVAALDAGEITQAQFVAAMEPVTDSWVGVSASNAALAERIIDLIAERRAQGGLLFQTVADLLAYEPIEPNTKAEVVADPAGEVTGGNGVWSFRNGEWAWLGARQTSGVAGLLAQASGEPLRLLRPNVIRPEEMAGRINPWTQNSAGDALMTLATVGTARRWRLVSSGGTTHRARILKPAQMFEADGLISWSLRIVGLTAGTFGRVRLIQRSATGSQLAVSAGVVLGNGGLSAPAVFAEDAAGAVPLVAPSDGTVEIDVSIGNTGSGGSRTIEIDPTSIVLAPGDSASLRHALEDHRMNLFPDPALVGVGAETFQAVADPSGELIMATGAGAAVAEWIVPATGDFAPGRMLRLQAEVLCPVIGTDSSADLSIRAYDANRAEITPRAATSATEAGAWHSREVTRLVPATAAAVGFAFVRRTGVASARFRNVLLNAPLSPRRPMLAPYGFVRTPRPRIYADPVAGDYANTGSRASPFRTVARALAFAGPSGEVILRAGLFNESIVLDGAQGLRISAMEGERPVITNGARLSGFTKTAGRNVVYQCAFAGVAPRYRLWEDGTPDAFSSVPAAQRSAYLRGRAYGLESTEILPAASVAAIDDAWAAGEGPRWYASGGVLYFSTSDGGAPSSRSFFVQNPNVDIIGGATGADDVRIDGIEVRYGYYGLNLQRCRNFLLTDVTAFGCRNDGVRYGNGGGETVGCRAVGNDNDGFNGTVLETAVQAEADSRVTHRDYVAMFNADDGHSDHDKFTSAMDGGLLAWNGDRGVALASGANARGRALHALGNGRARYRAMIGANFNDGSGFAAISAPGAAGNSVAGVLELSDCLSETNVWNVFAQGVTNTVVVRSVISRGGLVGYRADGGSIRGALAYSQADATPTQTVNAGAAPTPILL